jgi:hypothetical protein
MVKIYQKKGDILRSISIPVDIEKGVTTRVTFTGGGISPASGNCSFSTDDKKLQNALEKHKLFNDPNGFALLVTVDNSARGDDENIVPGVNDLASAKKYILANYKGYTQSDVSTAEKVMALAAELGISFPDWSV